MLWFLHKKWRCSKKTMMCSPLKKKFELFLFIYHPYIFSFQTLCLKKIIIFKDILEVILNVPNCVFGWVLPNPALCPWPPGSVVWPAGWAATLVYWGRQVRRQLAGQHRRRTNTEDKAKVVADAWWTEFIQFLAMLAIWH